MEADLVVTVVTTATAVVGAVSGLAALAISLRADKRSTRAEEQGELIRQDALWTDVIVAAQALIGANVLDSDMREILLRLRTASVELIDGLPMDLIPPLGDWLAQEHRLIALLFEKAIDQLEGRPHTLEAVEAAHATPGQCAGALLTNLRVVRRSERGENLNEQIQELAEIAGRNASHLTSEEGRSDG